MKFLKSGILSVAVIMLTTSCTEKESTQSNPKMKDGNMMIRIAEIEIDTAFIDEYTAILKEESEASVRLEPGVICIFPMVQNENPAEVRLIEIYENKAAYEAHLQTPHFLHYKTTTLKMVKSLRLVPMDAIDQESMSKIFKKLNE